MLRLMTIRLLLGMMEWGGVAVSAGRTRWLNRDR
jgi:hypothetical protein